MSAPPSSGRRERVHAAIEAFLQVRLATKTDKLPPDDPQRTALTAQHQRSTWLADAARRVAQIQAVTHSLKPIHPDARGTNLYVPPSQLPQRTELGSHVLGPQFASDVVGNAAALDVYKLLKLDVDGRTLLEWLLTGDADAQAALSDDAAQATAWRDAFVGLTQPRGDAVSSHTQAKQLYWLAEGTDPTYDDAYHLLAPLYASSLAHAAFLTLQDDRFGDANKEARQARRDKRAHGRAYHDYPNLAVQKLGGTKPQNISQLNSERGGSNYLLGSLPPSWKSQDVSTPWHMDSVFEKVYGYRKEVRTIVRDLLYFLKSDPSPNKDTRNRVDEAIEALIDELLEMAGRFQHGLEAGWSADKRCDLHEAERLWLDPERAALADEADFLAQWMQQDWPAQIGHRFGNWLNKQLDNLLHGSEVTQREWKKALLVDERDTGWASELHGMRGRLGAPTYIPAREGKA
ncbi:type I-F CRISPR-associated protein Csy1 [Xylophilus sp. GW821-FHT01B05]